MLAGLAMGGVAGRTPAAWRAMPRRGRYSMTQAPPFRGRPLEQMAVSGMATAQLEHFGMVSPYAVSCRRFSPDGGLGVRAKTSSMVMPSTGAYRRAETSPICRTPEVWAATVGYGAPDLRDSSFPVKPFAFIACFKFMGLFSTLV